MTRFILAAGVAALAITAPASAAPGGKGGHGHAQANHKQNHGRSAKGGHSSHGYAQQAKRGAPKHARQARNTHGQPKHERHAQAHAQHRAKPNGHRARIAQAHSNDHSDRNAHIANRGRGHEAQRRAAIARNRSHDARQVLARRENRGNRDNGRITYAQNGVGYGVGGCPPGLAKKRVACMPPGQARKLVGQRYDRVRDRVNLRELPRSLRYVYRDTPDYYYRYGDGYAYRVSRKDQLISALMPLFGLGYTAGQQFPAAYPNYGMPAAYQPFYPNYGNYDYRYANGYMYQLNPNTGLIQNVDPLLGYGYGYGQMMPATYSAYNVPYQYRPLYSDSSNAYYRYAPGAIYQVDPQTSLITGVAALLTNGMAVGQPLPTGYGAYNVPYGYRGQYYDTANDWYRYSNGNIYRVDPTTQLVTAIVASILT